MRRRTRDARDARDARTNERKTRAMSIEIVVTRTDPPRRAAPHIMPPRRGKSSRAAAAAAAAPADDAMDVDAPTTSARAGSAGEVALELAAARNALRDAIDRATALGHWKIPPESACARDRETRRDRNRLPARGRLTTRARAQASLNSRICWITRGESVTRRSRRARTYPARRCVE